jgi:hypothetical protein
MRARGSTFLAGQITTGNQHTKKLAMGKVIQFKKPLPTKGSSLCREGHHKWKVVTKKQFDVKQGKLVTCYECQRCGKKKVKAL